MPGASKDRGEVRCSKCHRVLERDDIIKCPRCKTLNSRLHQFATEMKQDQLIVAFLWRPDGGMASSISIRKEIWSNTGSFPGVPTDQIEFPVFHLYNHIDPSKAHGPDSGCRVNPLNKPYLKLEDAFVLAKRFEEEALASGKWVRVEDLKSIQ